MIWHKSYQLKTNRNGVFASLSNKNDHKVHAVYKTIKTYISYINKKSAIALIQWIAYHILSWARSAYIFLHRKAHAHPPSKKVIDMVRGKGDVPKNAGASFYLKRIVEEEIVK